MCLNWSDVELQGNRVQDYYTLLDVMYLPCNVKESIFDRGSSQFEVRIPENCNYDRAEFLEYLGSFVDMIVYSNTFNFE